VKASPKSTRQARRRRGGGFRPGSFFQRHAYALVSSLGHLARRPWASLMTATVLGVALALPSGLLVGVRNLERLGGGWLAPDQAAVFLVPGSEAGETLYAALEADERVAAARLVPPDEALTEFRERSGLAEALAALDENPLPTVITLVLEPGLENPEALVAELDARVEVDFVQFDRLWAERFDSVLAVARRAALVAGAALLLAVLLTIGNTIRLDIAGRREEIEVTRLVGGTDAFIRQPFLYGGLWYGLGAGVLACLLVGLAVWLLQGPVGRLGAAYGADLALTGLSPRELLGLILGGAATGWLGSRIAVARHLARIEPT
jgi:cell division transport system permease protein